MPRNKVLVPWTPARDAALVSRYLAGDESVAQICHRFQIGSRTLYRRLAHLGVPRARGHKGSLGRFTPITVYPVADPLIYELLRAARDQRVNFAEFVTLSGVSLSTLTAWNRGARDPKLSLLHKAGAALGYKLVWEEIEP